MSAWTINPLDARKYLAFCKEAATTDAFARFKRHPRYTKILEHVSEELGCHYLNYIRLHYPWLVQYFEVFQENDCLGNPKISRYVHWPDDGEYAEFSPTTLRYIKVLGDLVCMFGSLDGMRIVEIGGGYGGQCKIISDLYTVDYVQIDAVEALTLQHRYLRSLGVNRVKYIAPRHLRSLRADLVISNYAFSELDEKTQRIYCDNIIRDSGRGYMIWNTPTRVKLPVVWRELPEEPQTSQHGRLIFWKENLEFRIDDRTRTR